MPDHPGSRSRTIPLALGIALGVYAIVAVAGLSVLGRPGMAESTAPIAGLVQWAGAERFVPAVWVLAVIAACGSLLSAVSRCLAVACALPFGAVIPGVGILLLGAVGWQSAAEVRRRSPRRATGRP